MKKDNPIWWQVFITEYLKNGQNATQAYLKAKPKVTEETAKVEAHRLLTNPNFKEVLQKALEKLGSKQELSREKWLNELTEVALVKGVEVNAMSKLKAVEILGKALGYLTDKVEHSGSIKFSISDVLDDDLRAENSEKA